MSSIIKERIVEQAPDGSWYSINAVTMIYEDLDGRHITFFCEPEGLYQTVLVGMRQMAQLDAENDENLPEEMSLLKKQLARVVKASVKALLMMWGDKLLTLFYGTKNHVHVPKDKKLDMVDWYMSEFTKLFIASMMKKDLVLTGQFVYPTAEGNTSGTAIVSINEVSTRPITVNVSPESDTSTPGQTGDTQSN